MYLEYCGKCGKKTYYVGGSSSWSNLRFCSDINCDNAVFTICGDAMGGSSDSHYPVVLFEEEHKLLFLLHAKSAPFLDVSRDIHMNLADTRLPYVSTNEVTPSIAKEIPLKIKSTRLQGEKVYIKGAPTKEPRYYTGTVCPLCGSELIVYQNQGENTYVYCENFNCMYESR